MLNKNKTFFAKAADVKKNWILVDAKNKVLGRLASQIAKVLRGKHKKNYTPHIDCGDNIVVINAQYVKLTGKKIQQKTYYRHTGYPGGIKEKKVSSMLNDSTSSTQVLDLAVKRMMPKESPLARRQMKNLFIYPNSTHKHQAQNPSLTQLIKVKNE